MSALRVLVNFSTRIPTNGSHFKEYGSLPHHQKPISLNHDSFSPLLVTKDHRRISVKFETHTHNKSMDHCREKQIWTIDQIGHLSIK